VDFTTLCVVNPSLDRSSLGFTGICPVNHSLGAGVM
jgi:hypothetical protein